VKTVAPLTQQNRIWMSDSNIPSSLRSSSMTLVEASDTGKQVLHLLESLQHASDEAGRREHADRLRALCADSSGCLMLKECGDMASQVLSASLGQASQARDYVTMSHLCAAVAGIAAAGDEGLLEQLLSAAIMQALRPAVVAPNDACAAAGLQALIALLRTHYGAVVKDALRVGLLADAVHLLRAVDPNLRRTRAETVRSLAAATLAAACAPGDVYGPHAAVSLCWDHDAMHALTDTVDAAQEGPLRTHAAEALANLVCVGGSRTHSALISAEGAEVLSELLSSNLLTAQRSALRAINALVSAGPKYHDTMAFAGILTPTLKLLGSDDPEIRALAAMVIEAFTLAPSSCKSVVACGGVQAMVECWERENASKTQFGRRRSLAPLSRRTSGNATVPEPSGQRSGVRSDPTMDMPQPKAADIGKSVGSPLDPADDVLPPARRRIPCALSNMVEFVGEAAVQREWHKTGRDFPRELHVAMSMLRHRVTGLPLTTADV
jgi:hypothetical protein